MQTQRALFTTGFIGKEGINLRYFYCLCWYHLRLVIVTCTANARVAAI